MPSNEWNPQNAVAAFTAALSKSGYDQKFRDRLLALPPSAREAVSEVGDINIPDDVVIVFHKDQLNEKYHAFFLPPFDPDNTALRHEYLTHFQASYNAWKPDAIPRTREWKKENAVPAFSDALSRSGHDSDFRDRLKASLQSARDAVSDEGKIDIANDIVILFYEGEFNAKYHVFYLPPFDEKNKGVVHDYAKYRKLSNLGA